MKKRYIFLWGLLFIAICAACTQPNGSKGQVPDAASAAAEPDGKPFVLSLTRPKLKHGGYGYVQTEYINRTEFYPESQTWNRPNIFHIAKEPVKLEKKTENGIMLYRIDDKPYVCIEKVSTDAESETWPDSYYYNWSYDRRFFYKFADTSSGGTLYRNQNTDSLEALILADGTGWEYLLVSEDSPFAAAETMCIDDFGLIIIDDTLFGSAKDFEIPFYANTRGIDQKTVFPLAEPEGEFDAGSGFPLTFECTRIPGLRYTFHASPAEDHMSTFADSRAENSRVLIKGTTILPMDELQKAHDATFAAYRENTEGCD